MGSSIEQQAPAPYRHRVLDGLPASLLGAEGKTPAVFNYLQRHAGMNREVRRLIAARIKPMPIVAALGSQELSRADSVVLGTLLTAGHRFGSFWSCVRRLTRGLKPGAVSYATAIDIQLLSAYEPGWLQLVLDEGALEAQCSEWPRIRSRLEEALEGFEVGTGSLGVFMLWRQLCADLDQWEHLGPARQSVVAGAVFSLSSIGWTDWFVREAVRVCPALETELGLLLDKDTEVSEELPAPPAPELEHLLERLDAVAQELHATPTREGVSDLLVLALDFEQVAAHLPSRAPAGAHLVRTCVQELLSHCRSLSLRPGCGWLDGELIAQIEARWEAACLAAGTPESLAQLAHDAAVAVGRSEEVAVEMSQVSGDIGRQQQEIRQLEQEIACRAGFAERKVVERKKTQAQKELLDAQSALEVLQDRILDALSPFAQTFDAGVDYRAVLEAGALPTESERANSAPVQEADASGVHPHMGQAAAALPAAPVEETPPTASAPAGSDAEVLARAESPADTGAGAGAGTGSDAAAAAVAAVPAPGVAAAAEEQPYVDSAGEMCRPVWQLLGHGRPGLAYHYACWLHEMHPRLRTAPQDLLAAVALARGLSFPDGGVQAALGARFQSLSPGQFDGDAPQAWNSAMNLLLVAATLRPMVLCPGTGASAVAGYLHQNGRYPALYSLVQSLRELSPLLMGLRVEPTAFRQARGEAAIRDDLQAVQNSAKDWLRVQAPAITIKFAAATNVWRHWLRPQGIVAQLIEPVIHNRVADLQRVQEQIANLSDADTVLRMIRDTDRRELRRRRGEDIHAGALEHLLRCLNDAVDVARGWVSLCELQGQHGNRMRGLLVQVRARIDDARQKVEQELSRRPEKDDWGLVAAAQRVALDTLRSVQELFDPKADLPRGEATPAEVLGRDLLCVPDLPVASDWQADLPAADAVGRVQEWLASPTDLSASLVRRLDRGDLHGAELIVALLSEGEQDMASTQLRQERERWKSELKRRIGECRRTVEVGSAYGYLADAERGGIEAQLAQWEAHLEGLGRFDSALAELKAATERVSAARRLKVEEIQGTLAHLPASVAGEAGVADVKKALADGDIATANELVSRLSQGLPPWPEIHEDDRDMLARFFPEAQKTIDAWLDGQKMETVSQAIRRGDEIPGVDARRMDGEPRHQVLKMFSAWSDMKLRRTVDAAWLKTVLTGLGLGTKSLARSESGSGRDVWLVETEPLEDRHVCQVPAFGSMARGRYRLVCLWDRPTEDDLLQAVGDTAMQRPTLLFYFGRMVERRWRELSRLAKIKRRSFVILDETLFLFLMGVQGSRLSAWFSCAFPFAYASPYDATAGLVPPEMFFGRAEELDAVRGPNGRCFIYGGRQLGKTALLKRAEQSFHAPARGHYARWIDLRAEGIGVSRAPGELWITLSDQLRHMGVTAADVAAVSVAKKGSIEALIRRIREFLDADPDRRILLLLDEADRFFEVDGRSDFGETRRLKQLMDDTARRFKVVFAGLHNVLRMTERANHPLAHFGEPIEIGPLRHGQEVREAEELVRTPIAAAGFVFESRSLVIRILAQTNYYPSLIQLYCSHLLRHMLERVGSPQRPMGPPYLITDRDIEQVYSSGALREEIRAKFRLTLQLDPRYEVVANALALDLLRGRFAHTTGMDWQQIRQSGAMYWWPEGFRDTGELDFRVLLDEMVGLGVLTVTQPGHYTLRNPNVLLLLGTQEEIEAVLIKEREPAVEFESATFRPPLRKTAGTPLRNVFTYQQMSALLQHANNLLVVTGTEAAGINRAQESIADYVGGSIAPVVIDQCTDRVSFLAALDQALDSRGNDTVSLLVVPDVVPWSHSWVDQARRKLSKRASSTRFVSLVFVAKPLTLWRMLRDEQTNAMLAPCLSLLHWSDGFLRHWLEERQLQVEADDRQRLAKLTGYWPELIVDAVGSSAEVRALRDRLSAAEARVGDPEAAARLSQRLGLDLPEPAAVLRELADLGDAVDADDFAQMTGRDKQQVERVLRWGELLGLVRREGASFWRLDCVAADVLLRCG